MGASNTLLIKREFQVDLPACAQRASMAKNSPLTKNRQTSESWPREEYIRRQRFLESSEAEPMRLQQTSSVFPSSSLEPEAISKAETNWFSNQRYYGAPFSEPASAFGFSLCANIPYLTITMAASTVRPCGPCRTAAGVQQQQHRRSVFEQLCHGSV